MGWGGNVMGTMEILGVDEKVLEGFMGWGPISTLISFMAILTK